MKVFCHMLVLLLAGTVIHCQAADWNFYGSARVSTFYRTKETPGKETSYYTQSLNSTARIGAKVQAGDTLAGRFEYGASGGNASLRHLFGEWTFGKGKLLVGQTDTPLNFSLSKQAVNNDSVLNAYGHVDGKRKPMVQLTFGNFAIAAISPETSDLGLASSVSEVDYPKFEVKYHLGMSAGYLEVAAGYQSYDLIDTTTNRNYDVTSYILALGGQIKLGAAYINADAWTGRNVEPYDYNFDPDGNPLISGASLIDNDAWGMLLVLGYTLNDMFSFEAGFGHVQSELDMAGVAEAKSESYYLQCTITLAPGVMAVPEIGRIDKMSDSSGARVEDTHYAGVKWQIDF